MPSPPGTAVPRTSRGRVDKPGNRLEDESLTCFVHNLQYVEGVLTLDGQSLDALATRFGSPLFVGSRTRIDENVTRFLRAFSGYGAPVILSYSTKTNSNLGVLQVLNEAGVTAGVCSGLDLAAARRAGFPPERIVFDGLAKRPEELGTAIESRISLINAESWDELVAIDQIGASLGRRVPVGLRVRLGPTPSQRLSAKSLLGISYERFGFDLESRTIQDVIERVGALANVQVVGLHAHEGSHYRTAGPYLQNLQRLFPLVQALSEKWPGAFAFLNLGGGFGVERVKPYGAWDMARNTLRRLTGGAADYDLSADRIDLNGLGAQISTAVTTAFGGARLPLPTLVFEPGRFVVGDAFVLICRVQLRKQVPGGSTWIVLDAGTNVIPTLLGFTEYHQVATVREAGPSTTEIVNLAGPLMYSSDVIMKSCRLPRLEPGALIAVLDIGAYTLAYSNQFLYPRPAAVLIDGDGPRVIRQAETYDDVLAQDRLSSVEALASHGSPAH